MFVNLLVLGIRFLVGLDLRAVFISFKSGCSDTQTAIAGRHLVAKRDTYRHTRKYGGRKSKGSRRILVSIATTSAK